MTNEVHVMKLLVSCEQVNDEMVWGARIDEIRHSRGPTECVR